MSRKKYDINGSQCMSENKLTTYYKIKNIEKFNRAV